MLTRSNLNFDQISILKEFIGEKGYSAEETARRVKCGYLICCGHTLSFFLLHFLEYYILSKDHIRCEEPRLLIKKHKK